MQKYVESDANEIEVTKVSNEYTCIHPADIKWQHDFSNSLAVLRVFLPVREKFVPSRVIFLFSVSDWIFERS